MIEYELHQAANDLPEPKTSFDAVRAEASNRSTSRPLFSFRRAALIALAAVLVFTMVAAGYRYDQIQRGMWLVYSASDWSSARNYLADYDLTFPEELMDYPYWSVQEYSVVPRGTELAQAMLTKFYRPISIVYAIDLPMEGNTDTSPDHWGPYVDIGVADGPYWKTYFSLNEEGIYDHSKYMVPGTLQIVEYNGMVIQLYLTQYSSGSQYANALWVDEARNACICIHMEDDNMTAALECARTIIDMNP